MIIPAIGEVPNWIIAYSSVAAVIVVYLIKRFLSFRVRNIEMYLDASLADIKEFFVWLSEKTRNPQIDTINADTSLLVFGVVLIFVIYMVMMLW